MKSLKELLENVLIININGNMDVSVSSVSINSKTIDPNSLFVALVGSTTDGHNFIDEVIEKGAKVIVHETNLPTYKEGITYIKVSDTHEAVGFIVSNFYENPSSKLKLVGVTGTNGKTTIATLLHQLFRNLGYKVGMIGTVVNKVNDKEYDSERTTPDSITLNKLFFEMVQEGCEYCFMEVSSHSVSEKRISGLTFCGGIFTNLTLDHLDYHKNLGNYCDAKKTFFDNLPDGSFALSNKDDENGEYVLANTQAFKSYYSLKHKADVKSHIVFTEHLETKLIGKFNLYNVLAVYGAAVMLGEDPEKVKELIKGLDPVPGRFQYIESPSGIMGIVDYAHTPDAIENVLRTIQDLALSRRKDLSKDIGEIITVIGCGGDRDKTKRGSMAKISYDMSDIVILTSDNPRSEKPEDILKEMQKGLNFPSNEKLFIIPDRHEAIKKACDMAREGDFVLIAGKGHEKYQEVNGVKTHFDDVEELQKYLK